ncbi:MAG: hypothetical protein HY960_12810 [Ignavibacteriae bacterium]|nr:hypothetical protein [Ignavibacteriota bacterium]
MKKILLAITTLSLLISFTGCGPGYGTYLKSVQAYQPTNAKDVRVYAVSQPEGEYIVIGYISVYDAQAQDKGNTLRDLLKERAAQLGANAIISFKLVLEPQAGGGAEGIAIRFK